MDLENETLYMANLLTRSWKRSVGLPPISKSGVISPPLSVWDTSSKAYKVIYVQLDGDDRIVDDPFDYNMHFHRDKWSIKIYEQKSNVWSTKRLDGDQSMSHHPVYLNEVLYMVAQCKLDRLLAMNMVEGVIVM